MRVRTQAHSEDPDQEAGATIGRGNQPKPALPQREAESSLESVGFEKAAVKTDPIFIPRSSIGSRFGDYSAWGLSGKTLGLLLLLLVLGSLVGSFYLNQASKTTAAGLEIGRLTRQRESWRQENANLAKQIAEMESLSRIQTRAQELGFVEPEVVEYLVVESAPLEHSETEESTPSHTAERERSTPQPQEPRDWWGELVAQLESWMSVDR